MKNKKGSNAAVAAIVIVMVIVLAFVVPWTLSLVNTSRTTVTNGITPNGSGPGSTSGLYATMGLRFELTELVDINQTRTGHWVWLNDDTLGRKWTINGRITSDVDATVAVGIIAFEPKTYEFTTGSGAHFFEYVADAAAETAIISPGWYKYVLEFRVDAPDIMDRITWNFGLKDVSEAGNVYRLHAFMDHDRDGVWEDFPLGELRPYMSLELRGNVIGGEPPAEEEEEEEPPLITTTEAKTGMRWEETWFLYAFLGGVIIIVLVVIVVAVKF